MIFNNFELKSMLYTIIALLIAIIPHEVAHGYAAYILGDETAKTDGRLSFNPINHIDPIGLLSMIIFRFGWAKAVPINPYKFNCNRKLGTIIVSLAGVFVNFVIAFVVGVIGVRPIVSGEPMSKLLFEIMWYNVMLGVFNLVPVPPLDGSKVVASLLPNRLEYYFYKYERYLYIFLLIGIFSSTINRIIGPIIIKIINLFLNTGIKLWTLM